MFKSIKFIRYEYDKNLNKHINYYHLVDDEFECEVSITAVLEIWACMSAAATEYSKRSFTIIRNLYLLNILLLEQRPSTSFEELLNNQNKHIDKYCPIPGINFSKDIYPELLKKYENLSIYV